MSSSYPALVWFLLLDSATGQPYKDTSASSVLRSSLVVDVADFRKAVKAEHSNTLSSCDAADLLVYKNKAAFDKRNDSVDDGKEEPLEEDSLIDGLGTSKKDALVVVVVRSSILPQQQQGGECLTFPPHQNSNMLQHPFSETAMAGIELMAADYLAKKRTIVLSEASYSATIDLLDMLSLPEKGASWPHRPAFLQHMDGFTWLQREEDHHENRTAYMAYLTKLLKIPAHYALADTQSNKQLLNVDLFRATSDTKKIRGTTDVAIAKAQHVRNEAIRNNIETLLELKTPKDMQRMDHTPQTICEHFAASYLNLDHAVVSVLTDLNLRWTFFWFAKGENDSKVALYKLCLDGGEATAEAKYLLDSLYDDSVGDNTLPTTFANRQSFQDVLDSFVIRNKRVRREFDHRADNRGLDPDSKPSPSGGLAQYPSIGTNALLSSGGTSQENHPGAASQGGGGDAPMSMASALSLFAPPGDRDVANELDLLDMVDESEQYEIVRSFASKHIVPYMTG